MWEVVYPFSNVLMQREWKSLSDVSYHGCCPLLNLPLLVQPIQHRQSNQTVDIIHILLSSTNERVCSQHPNRIVPRYCSGISRKQRLWNNPLTQEAHELQIIGCSRIMPCNLLKRNEPRCCDRIL